MLLTANRLTGDECSSVREKWQRFNALLKTSEAGTYAYPLCPLARTVGSVDASFSLLVSSTYHCCYCRVVLEPNEGRLKPP